jgi:hypothetical protein
VCVCACVRAFVKRDSGLALPVLLTFHKQQQASRSTLFSTSRDSCVFRIKQSITEADAASRKSHLLNLPVQRKIFTFDVDYSYWVEAGPSLPGREMTFAYNASIDTLPTHSNLRSSTVQRSGFGSMQAM